MAEYYVIKDKNTGLYFRGRGVNRWGKHYNQASIYRVKGTAEHSIKEIAWRGEQAEVVPIQIIETTADVVPKSEVEELKAIIADHKASEERLEELYSNAKTEVAREIFAELLKEASLRFDGFRNTIIFPLNYYNELKKKYTGEET